MLIRGLGKHSILQQRKYRQCQRPYQRPTVIRSHVRSPCKSLYTGRIGEGLPCKQAFSLRPPCKPNDYSSLHPKVPVHWYFRTIGVYFPGSHNSFRGRGIFSAMLLAISIVALSQFALYYWRAVMLGVTARPLFGPVACSAPTADRPAPA